MSNDIYSFAEIRNAYDIRADILFAYQSDAETNIDFCGVKAESRELKLSQAMAAISLDTMMEDFLHIGFTHHSVILGKIKEIDERITNY